jgi:hypothetical protein
MYCAASSADAFFTRSIIWKRWQKLMWWKKKPVWHNNLVGQSQENFDSAATKAMGLSKSFTLIAYTSSKMSGVLSPCKRSHVLMLTLNEHDDDCCSAIYAAISTE